MGKKAKTFLTRIYQGAVMGTADVVPGVSGATMALILGIYLELVNAIKSFDMKWLRAIFTLQWDVAIGRPHFMFVIPLFSGIVMAIIFFTQVVPLPKLLVSHPEKIYSVFFGLIIGSIIFLLRSFRPITWKKFFFFTVGLALGFTVLSIVPSNYPDTPLFIFATGILGACAMISPGISGSFVLLLLGKYSVVLDAIGNIEPAILIPFILGFGVGICLFARLLSSIIKKFPTAFTLGIAGFLTASLYRIWPFQERIYTTVDGKLRLVSSSPELPVLSSTTLYSLVLVIIGVSIILMIQYFSQKKSVYNQ
jgi:putative membrane protein